MDAGAGPWHDPPVPAPGGIDDTTEAQLLRSRLRAYVFISGVTWAVHAVAYLALERLWIGTSNGLAAVATLAVALVLPRARGLRELSWVTHALTAIVVGALASSAYGTGQALSMPIWFLVVVPLAAGFALGRRPAIAWALVVVVVMALLHLAGVFSPRPAEFVPSTVELLVGQGTLAVLVLALALVSRGAADRQIAEIALRESTIQKQAEELLRARDEALAGSRAKSVFLATMTHEIRTPLNGVLGMARLLERTVSDPRTKEQVETIRAGGETLLSLVNDVLDFSKIEAGKLELDPQPTSPRRLVEDALRVVRSFAADKDLSLSLSVADDVPEGVLLDASKLRQILLNLLGNAAKFTDRGAITVTVRAPSERLVISVADTGIGIAEAQRDRIFLPFSQGDGSASRRHEGTGLGLSISQRLAHAMGGDITVDSTLGKGTTFIVEVSAARTAAPILAPEPTQVAGLSSGLRILLVEDNAANELVALRMLEHLGTRADVVRDGHAAVERLFSEHYDLVLLDYRLPLLSGPDVARAVRAGAPHQPHIVAMTANATAEDRATCRDAGMEDFLAKPVDLDALASVLGQLAPSFPVPSSPAPSSPASAPIEDMLGPGDIVDVLEPFLQQLRSMPGALTEALEARDAARAADLLHNVRPNARMFGAEALATQCQSLELRARADDLASLEGGLAEARSLCEAAERDLLKRREAWLEEARRQG